MAKHALIIEDNPANLDVLVELLHGEDVDCTSILDPREVEKVVQTQAPPDLIFLDLEMPYINGYDVLDILQKSTGWSNVPVVVCTVHTSELKNARARPFHSFLGKPLDADRFSDQLSRILRGEKVWDVNPL